MLSPFKFRSKRSSLKGNLDIDDSFPQGIEILHSPDSALADIVFVHGLTGDRERTWTAPENGVFWPRDLLPSSVPDARILTFGYDAYIVRRQGRVSMNRLAHHALDLVNALASCRQENGSPEAYRDRPIIFVAHSLGGLVCKDALRVSRESSNQHLKTIYHLTIAIAFMGTPHSGSSLASKAKLSARSVGLVKQANTDLLGVLETSSEVLSRVSDDFAATIRHRSEGQSSQKPPLSIVCFYESLPSPIIGMIVPTESAILRGFNHISIHADHRSMVRFKDSRDPGFLSVAHEIQTWINDIKYRVSREPKETDVIACLESLAFAEMDARQANIEGAAANTCEWIFHHPTYLTWRLREQLTDTHALLWVKGKPGSGKSTLMKRLFKAREFAKEQSSTIALAFFFNARGVGIEKSPIGMYRTLVSQLLRESRSLLRDFVPLYLRKLKALGPENFCWHLSELRDFLFEAITRPDLPEIDIFIDALDECNEEDVRQTVRSLETSAAKAFLSGAKVNMCWSSRHYPHIDAEKALELRLEDLNAQDIKLLVQREMAPFQHLDFGVDFEQEIVRKASGVFLWANLVMRKLLKALDQGRSVRYMRELLESVPSELDQLFEDIVNSIDPSLDFETRSIFRWVVLAYRPLSLDEFQLILTYGSDSPPTSLMAWEASLQGWERPEADSNMRCNQLRKLVTESSGGLIEVVKRHPMAEPPDHLDTAKSLDGHVHDFLSTDPFLLQVIHESVRDYFLKDGASSLFLREDWTVSAIERCHGQLFGVCRAFLESREFAFCVPDSARQRLFGRRPPRDVLVANLWMRKSFTAYALEFLYDHARAAARVGPLMGDHHKQGGQALLRLWRSLSSSLWNFGAKWVALNSKNSEPALFSVYLSSPSTLEEEDNCTINSHTGILAALDSGLCFSRLGYGPAMCAAAHHGRNENVKQFLDRGTDIDFQTKSGRTALHEAVAGGHLSTAEFLLRCHADMKVKARRETPLELAARKGSFEMAKLLSSWGAEPSDHIAYGGTLLHAAARYGQIDLALRLLNDGVDIEARDQFHCTALQRAVQGRCESAVEFLLENGADIEAVDEAGESALDRAAGYRDETMVQLLLQRGAKESAAFIALRDGKNERVPFEAITAQNLSTLIHQSSYDSLKDYLGDSQLIHQNSYDSLEHGLGYSIPHQNSSESLEAIYGSQIDSDGGDRLV